MLKTTSSPRPRALRRPDSQELRDAEDAKTAADGVVAAAIVTVDGDRYRLGGDDFSEPGTARRARRRTGHGDVKRDRYRWQHQPRLHSRIVQSRYGRPGSAGHRLLGRGQRISIPTVSRTMALPTPTASGEPGGTPTVYLDGTTTVALELRG